MELVDDASEPYRQWLVDDGTTSAEGSAERYRSEVVDVGVRVVAMIDGVSKKEFRQR